MKNTEKQEAIASLKKLMGRNRTVYTIVRHAARSGMNRSISCYIAHKGEIICIDWHVSRILGWSISRNHGGVNVSGCGMDMGFHLVYSLSSCLFRNVNGRSQGAGYKLTQRWL